MHDEKSQVLSNLQQNEFIAPETLETFILRKQGRPGKKIYFDKQPGSKDKRDLLYGYLKEMKDREEAKQREKDDDMLA